MPYKVQLILNRIYRVARNYAYWFLEPFDAIFRKINQLDQYPPIRLRRHAGHFGSFDGVAFEFLSYLRFLLAMKPEHRLWDIGCGCGLLELALETAGFHNSLVGVDIHRPSIKWAQRTISKRVSNFRFIHADICNEAYWPYGKFSASEWFSVFREKDFDIAIAKSLFTHMLPEELSVYLTQISLRLKTGGKALLTFFLLNSQQQKLKSQNKIVFTKPNNKSAYALKNLYAPTAAVAYEEAYILDLLSKKHFGLLGDIYYGSWTSIENPLSYQDIILVTK